MGAVRERRGRARKPPTNPTGSPSTTSTATFHRIYDVVRRIPPGATMSYGDVARQIGLRNGARTVGWALASLPDIEAVPWWRVVRADGGIAPRPFAAEQRRRLRAEGVRFGRDGKARSRRHDGVERRSATGSFDRGDVPKDRDWERQKTRQPCDQR